MCHNAWENVVFGSSISDMRLLDLIRDYRFAGMEFGAALDKARIELGVKQDAKGRWQYGDML